ncbi:hypothetical protein GCM10027436_16940 [Actinophytocola sediminis]
MGRLAGPGATENQGCHGRTLSCAAVDYRWSCEDSPTFADQAAAEDWLGDAWAELLARGVDEVTLLGDGDPVYGPMSLHPPGD